MFIDYGKIIRVLGQQPIVVKTKAELNFDEAREEWQKYISQ